MKYAAYSGLFLLALVNAGAAGDMQPPRLSFAQVDWVAATATLAEIDELRPLAMPGRLRAGHGATRPPVSSALSLLNTLMAQRFTGIATSPVPVLLPFDTTALLREQADGIAANDNDRYLSGFHAAQFFYPGPSGYDAAFAIRTSDVPEWSESSYRDPIEVQISGSLLLYELDPPIVANGQPVPVLEAEFPGIRRLILEHHLRYTFVRFGVPYVVSITCFDAGVARYRMPTCRTAEQVAMRFLRALHIVGGTPQKQRSPRIQPVERPQSMSETFSYYSPGQILSGTGFHGLRGRADYTVYSQIRFPLAEAPAYDNSQMFQNRNRSPDPNVSPNYSYPWRDNFCERRGFPVGQCPAGIGHQGQDIRPARCTPPPGAERCSQSSDLVAVRGGVILRSPKQEAAYLFVNSADEHIRFRYLHMLPGKMDQDQLLSGRRVHEGEVIGQVGNYNNRANGTSYHLHFDIQVPTKDGWVFVNPYMTLVAAYERLIGERGRELDDTPKVSVADAEVTGAIVPLPPEPPHQALASTVPILPAEPQKTLAPAAEIMRTEPQQAHRSKFRRHARHHSTRHARHQPTRHHVRQASR